MIKYINNTTAQAMINGFKSKFGNNSALKTTSKNFVGAINELKLAIANLPQSQPQNNILYENGNNVIRANSTRIDDGYANSDIHVLQYSTDGGITWNDSADINGESMGDRWEYSPQNTISVDDKVFINGYNNGQGYAWDNSKYGELICSSDNGESFASVGYIHSGSIGRVKQIVKDTNTDNLTIVSDNGIFYVTPNCYDGTKIHFEIPIVHQMNFDTSNSLYLSHDKILQHSTYNVNKPMLKEICSMQYMNMPMFFRQGNSYSRVIVTDVRPDSTATKVYAYLGDIDAQPWNDITAYWVEHLCDIVTIDSKKYIAVPISAIRDSSEDIWYIPIDQDIIIPGSKNGNTKYSFKINDTTYHNHYSDFNSYRTDGSNHTRFIHYNNQDNTTTMLLDLKHDDSSIKYPTIVAKITNDKNIYYYKPNYYNIQNAVFNESTNKYEATGILTSGDTTEQQIESTDAITWTVSN